MTSRFDHVLFDAGGTLLGTHTHHERWYEQFFVDACAECGVRVTSDLVGAALKSAARTCPLTERFDAPESVRAYWEHTYSSCFAQLMPGCDASDLARHYVERFETGEYIQLFPDTLEALEMLRARGLAMGIVSNFGTYLGDFLEKLGIARYFRFVLISAVEGCEKPHDEIFTRAIARTGAAPGRTMYVGDHPLEDYAAAERHGLFAVLIDRHDRHAGRPDLRRVRRLGQLEQYL